MTKAVTHSLISIAIFGVMQTSSVAQDFYFNNITFQPPNPALCYLQQSPPCCSSNTAYRSISVSLRQVRR